MTNNFEKNGAVVMTPERGTGFTVLFPVPAMAPDRKLPAAIQSVMLIVKDGSQRTLRVAIKRDLTVPVSSITFRFRFSNLPVYMQDNGHRFNACEYTESDLNTSQVITFTAAVPESMNIDACSAYISEITLLGGERLTYGAAEYRYIRRPKNPTAATQSPAQRTPSAAPLAHTPHTAPAVRVSKKNRSLKLASTITELLKPKNRKKLTVILCALALVLIGELVGGICLSQYLGVKNSTDVLMKEERYNEAYKIALDSPYDSLLQRVCEKASDYYFGKGDLESSYVYAVGAPKDFTHEVIEKASQSVVSMITGDINESAFRVAKMSTDNSIFDVIVHSMIDILEDRGYFSNALRIASEIRNPQDREATEFKVFDDAIDYYSENHRYDRAQAFLEEIDSITTFELSEKEALTAAMERFAELSDHAGIIYFAHHYPDVEAPAGSDIKVVSEDGGVRAELAIVYPVLNDEQKRIYHSQKMAIWNDELLEIEDGKLTVGGVKLKNAVSVDTNENAALVLHKNGSVTLAPHKNRSAGFTVPEVDGIVDIALGENHAVLLKADGTVIAYGDNTYGQTDVSSWSDIAAIAAGQHFTLGLKVDGTVVASGDNSALQCQVMGYNNVVDIAACNQSSVLLFSDGTLKLVGYRSMGLSEVETAMDINRIRAGGSAVLCEMKNGEYKLFTGIVSGDYGNPYNWRKMDTFDVGMMCIVGRDKSGALFYDGDGYVE